MKISFTIGLLLLLLHSAFPPRINPASPNLQVTRAFILSPYFYYSRYTKTTVGDPSKKVFRIFQSPAEFDWGRYVGVGVMILSSSGFLGLVLSGRSTSKIKSEPQKE